MRQNISNSTIIYLQCRCIKTVVFIYPDSFLHDIKVMKSFRAFPGIFSCALFLNNQIKKKTATKRQPIKFSEVYWQFEIPFKMLDMTNRNTDRKGSRWIDTFS